jgi:hypothetical protein
VEGEVAGSNGPVEAGRISSEVVVGTSGEAVDRFGEEADSIEEGVGRCCSLNRTFEFIFYFNVFYL